MSEENLKDLERICLTYGYEAQSRQAIEEMAELTQAINKKWRKETYAVSENEKQKDFNDHIAEEIADVYICLKQIEMLLSIDADVNAYVDKKIERTLNRIGGKNE